MKIVFLAFVLAVLFSGCERELRTEEDVLNSFLKGSVLENRASDIRRLSKGEGSTFTFSVYFSESFTPDSFQKMGMQEITDQKKKSRITGNARKKYDILGTSVIEAYVFEGLYSGLWLEGVRTEKSVIIFANRF